MSQGISMGPTITADGTQTLDVTGFSADRWSVYVDGGTFDGGFIQPQGSYDGITFSPTGVFDPADGSLSGIQFGPFLGLYTFDLLTNFMRFSLAGSTSPSLDLTLFPMPRY